MREIKFRGKKISDRKWVHGYLTMVENDYAIIECDSEYGRYGHLVYTNTVGQYTGLKDANGKEIYEGDILDLYIPKNAVGKPEHRLRKVIWEDSGFNITNKDGDCIMDRVSSSIELIYTVIGNIHDNPELIEK